MQRIRRVGAPKAVSCTWFHGKPSTIEVEVMLNFIASESWVRAFLHYDEEEVAEAKNGELSPSLVTLRPGEDRLSFRATEESMEQRLSWIDQWIVATNEKLYAAEEPEALELRSLEAELAAKQQWEIVLADLNEKLWRFSVDSGPKGP